MPKPKKISAFQQIVNEIAGNETNTSIERYKYPKVKNETFPMSGYNEMCDILMLPTTSVKTGSYRYLLTIVDIWSNYFDIEPLKTKTAKETLKALLTIFKRHYVSVPKASLRTDNGGEFKEVFNKWLVDHKILHSLSKPDRHKQLGNVENLNRQIGRIIMTYLTNQEIATGKPFSEWLDLIPKIRTELNKMKFHPKDKDPFKDPMTEVNINQPPKYKVGDLVHYPLEKPEGFGNKFRAGDRRYSLDTKKIKFVLIYSSPNPYRYLLSGVPDVSYAEAELIPAKGNVETFIIREIFDKKTVKGKVFYNVWWKKYLKKDSTWEQKENLIEDGAEEYIKQYEDKNKK